MSELLATLVDAEPEITLKPKNVILDNEAIGTVEPTKGRWHACLKIDMGDVYPFSALIQGHADTPEEAIEIGIERTILGHQIIIEKMKALRTRLFAQDEREEQ